MDELQTPYPSCVLPMPGTPPKESIQIEWADSNNIWSLVDKGKND